MSHAFVPLTVAKLSTLRTSPFLDHFLVFIQYFRLNVLLSVYSISIFNEFYFHLKFQQYSI